MGWNVTKSDKFWVLYNFTHCDFFVNLQNIIYSMFNGTTNAQVFSWEVLHENTSDILLNFGLEHIVIDIRYKYLKYENVSCTVFTLL